MRASSYFLLSFAVLMKVGGGYAQETQLPKPPADVVREFGRSVAISQDGQHAVVATLVDVGPDVGYDSHMLYYTRNLDHTWALASRLILPNDDFCDAVAISGGGHRVVLGGCDGRAYVYQRQGGTQSWELQATLAVEDRPPFHYGFGSSVAVSSDGLFVAVGAYRGVHVYAWNGGQWPLHTVIDITDGGTSGLQGVAVAFSAQGGHLILGVTRELTETGYSEVGSALVYARMGDTWIQEARLLASDGEDRDQFGNAVAISGDGEYAVVGAWNANNYGTRSGSAYIFQRNSAGAWTEVLKLIGDDGIRNRFGESVAISSNGRYIIIGAPGACYLGIDSFCSGEARLYSRNGSRWTLLRQIRGEDRTAGDRFGASVAISEGGRHVLVGAPQNGPVHAPDAEGKVYSYVLDHPTGKESGVNDDGLSLRMLGPHPVMDKATAELRTEISQPIRAEIYDAAGRLLDVIHSGTALNTSPVQFGWGVQELAAGIYILRVRGEHFDLALPFVVAR